MDRLFAMLSHGIGVSEKQAQFACFILNNIFQLGTQKAHEFFQKYERVLTLVTFNDENLSPITSAILFTLSGRRADQQDGRENAAITNMRMNLRNEIESNISEDESDE